MEDEPPKEPLAKPAYYYPFSYPAPIPCSEEKKREYDEIGERIVEQLKGRGVAGCRERVVRQPPGRGQASSRVDNR